MLWLALSVLFLPLWVMKTITAWIPFLGAFFKHLFMLNEFVRMFGILPHIQGGSDRVLNILVGIEKQISRQEGLSFALMEDRIQQQNRLYHAIDTAKYFKL